MNGRIKEKLLLYRIRTRKDPDAFAALYDLYIDKIYRFVYFKILNKEETEDLTSEVFLKTWNYLIEEADKEVRSFSGLVYQIARNAVVDFYRQRAKQQNYPFEQLAELAGDNQEILQIENAQAVEKVMQSLWKLKREYQEVLLLRYVEELTVAEIAEILGKGQISVRVTLHRAVKKLKEMLDKHDS